MLTKLVGEFQLATLRAVQRLRSSAYGTRIRDEIAAHTGGNVHLPQVYTALGRLEALGFLESSLDKENLGRGRTRRRYKLSAPALKLLAATSKLDDREPGRYEQRKKAHPA